MAVAAIAVIASCTSRPPQSTRLTLSDFDHGSAQVSQRLMESSMLAERSAASEPMVIAIQRVTNLTSDLIPQAEQWQWVQRLRAQLINSGLARDRAVFFVVPREQEQQAKADGTIEPDAFAGRDPTHEMTATFLSATRASGMDRTESYLCEFRITSIGSGELVWNDTLEIKRIARGRSYD